MEPFLNAAVSISQLSTDPKTQVGVLFVRNGSIVASGCNTIPDRLAVTANRVNVVETRSKFTEHAERSAVYAAARHGISLQGTHVSPHYFHASNVHGRLSVAVQLSCGAPLLICLAGQNGQSPGSFHNKCWRKQGSRLLTHQSK